MHRGLSAACCAITVAALQSVAPLQRTPVRRTTRLRAAEPQYWDWQDNTIRYTSEGPADGQPVLFLHGFGSSLETYRDNAPALAQAGYRCHRLDLLGLGLSTKASGAYSIGRWREQAAAFLEANANGKPSIMLGNSIGSLISLDVAAKRPELVKGVILNNCAGGMNSKFALTDPAVPESSQAASRVFFGVLDFLLGIKPLARLLFDKVRTPETVRSLLEGGVYQNAARVDDELVRMLTRPAEDAGALETFVEILTGEPGPRPESLVPLISAQTPIACWWGPEDQVTPLIGVVGQFFRRLPAERASAEFTLLPGTGHCPFDDRPDLASPALIAWLDREWPAA